MKCILCRDRQAEVDWGKSCVESMSPAVCATQLIERGKRDEETEETEREKECSMQPFLLSPSLPISPFLALQHLDQSQGRSYGGQKGGKPLAASLMRACPIRIDAYILGLWTPSHPPLGRRAEPAVSHAGGVIVSVQDLTHSLTLSHTHTHTHE